VSIEAWPTMPVMRTSVLMSRRMARRSRRGVGMKGTGRSMVRRVVGMERARARVVCAW
jgi:hypothetical protein